jgi:hypothetical protein
MNEQRRASAQSQLSGLRWRRSSIVSCLVVLRLERFVSYLRKPGAWRARPFLLVRGGTPSAWWLFNAFGCSLTVKINVNVQCQSSLLARRRRIGTKEFTVRNKRTKFRIVCLAVRRVVGWWQDAIGRTCTVRMIETRRHIVPVRDRDRDID